MKKMILSFALLALALPLLAQEKSTGCGLGWQVTKKMTTSAASTRASTNATSSNTSAMTSGTSGCDKHSIVKAKNFEQHFIEANHELVALDLAMGGGEFATIWASLHGCSDNNQQAFNNFAKKYIQNIINIKANDVVLFLQEFNQSLSKEDIVKKACKPLV